MKKFFAFLFFLSLFLPQLVLAQDPLPLGPCSADIGNKFDELCRSSANDVNAIIPRAIVAVLIVAAILTLIFLIWGGIKWILSGGDKAKVETARNTIVAAIVGLILTLLSYFILEVVLNLFGLKLSNLDIPVLVK